MLLAAVVLYQVCAPHSNRPSAQRVMAQAQEESLAVASFEACKHRLPGLRFRRQELIYRAPGRYQVVRRRAKDQISCATWQGQVQHVDTSIMQLGNGQ